MSLGEERKSETPWALCLTKEATPLAPKRQLISYVNPQTRIARYLPSVGTRMNPGWVSVTSSKSEERGWREYLQGGSSNQDSYLKVEACSQVQGWTWGQILTLWDGFEVHLLVNTLPLQVVHTHTHGAATHSLWVCTTQKRPLGKWLALILRVRRTVGVPMTFWGWLPTATQGWYWKGLHWVWTGILLKTFF